MLQSPRLRQRPRLGLRLPRLAAWVAALLLSAPLMAGGAVVTVRYTSVDLLDAITGQDLRAYDYVINGGFSDGDTLTLEFPAAAYSDLDVLSGPATLLAAQLLQPDAGLGTSGLLMLTAPTALPATFQDNLRVSFVWLVGGNPGVQNFDIVDSNFATVQPTSLTVDATAQPLPVPEPPAGALLLTAGLALLAVLRRSLSPRCPPPH